MLKSLRAAQSTVVTVGFAAPSGGGASVAFATMRGDGRSESLVRVGFRCRPLAALHGRDVCYAALDAVAAELLRRGVRAVAFLIADDEVATDLRERRAVPAPLTLPYVALRCRLNRFVSSSLDVGDERRARDLSARARAEIRLTVAA